MGCHVLMDAATWAPTVVAVVAIIASFLSPLVTERMRRMSAREERLLTERLSVYGELLEAVGRIADNAQTWAAVPQASLDEPGQDELGRIDARVRVLGSEQVRADTEHFRIASIRFAQSLFQARGVHDHRDAVGADETPETIRARMNLGTLAEDLWRLRVKVEESVRRDVSG